MTAHLELIRAHFDKLLATGTADFGPAPCPMWMASIDPRTGRYPDDDTRPPEIPRRHYRAIDAPRGCSLYWDQPAAVAAHALSRITGDARYSDAVDRYVEAFLERCVARNGMLLWGNHYFWDAFQGRTLKFCGNETPFPVDFDAEEGDYHEARPIPPAWELFQRVSPDATRRAIEVFAARSLFDPATGGFNRHADQRRGCAFIESGGILVESLAWLHARTGDGALLEQADRIADFSHRHRDPRTGLMENNPTVERWDKFACTTEVGLWAGSLLRAAARCGGREAWIAKADQAVSAYLAYGYDERAGRYYGRLRVADGAPVLGAGGTEQDVTQSLTHQPGDYADVWRPLFPAHDYPMPMAECCLRLHELTGAERYRRACERWIEHIARSLPPREGRGAYAEHYGRCIHFLWRCEHALASRRAGELARTLAHEAVDALSDHGMFRSHPGEHRYDAVDGVGYLLLALIALATGEEPDMMGSGW
ncbi:MAG: hypothetical protein ACODAQ_07750 [Phycisphaeraceae bacterium]